MPAPTPAQVNHVLECALARCGTTEDLSVLAHEVVALREALDRKRAIAQRLSNDSVNLAAELRKLKADFDFSVICATTTPPADTRPAMMAAASPLMLAFYDLGVKVFGRVTDHIASGECDEWCHEVIGMATKLGLATQEVYDKAKHSHLEVGDAAPGDLIWLWSHLPDGWKEGNPAWESFTSDNGIANDPRKRCTLRIYDRARFEEATK